MYSLCFCAASHAQYYIGGLNRTNCCGKGICSECYFAIRDPNESTTCPYCLTEGLSVIFRGPLTEEEKRSIEAVSGSLF